MAFEHRPITPEMVKMINETPFLASICYDLDLLPEQFLALKDDENYPLMFERLRGVLICWKAMQNPE